MRLEDHTFLLYMLKISNTQELSCTPSGQGCSLLVKYLPSTHEGWNVVAIRPLGLNETLLLKTAKTRKCVFLLILKISAVFLNVTFF